MLFTVRFDSLQKTPEIQIRAKNAYHVLKKVRSQPLPLFSRAIRVFREGKLQSMEVVKL